MPVEVVDVSEEVVEYLNRTAGGNSFSKSLLAFYEKRGGLSVKQLAAILKNMGESSAAKSLVEAPDIKLSGIVEAFSLASTVLQKPMLYFSNLRIKKAPAHGNNPGYYYVTNGDSYFGKIAPNGDFTGTKSVDGEVMQLLASINRDPKNAAIEHGRSTGVCCCCGAGLTDPKSVAAGIGPVCATKWGFN